MQVEEKQQTVLYEVSDRVAWIRLNRPDRMNAIDTELRGELSAALKRAERDSDARCVVITGSGRAFSAGADVREFGEAVKTQFGQADASEAVGAMLREQYMPLILRLRTMHKPVIAAVNGVAAGIGASIAMACDIRLAAPEASFVEAFVLIALAPDGGASWLLPRLVGTGKALEMLMTGAPLSAQEAERFGLVNRVVPANELESATRELAARLAAGPQKVIAAAKRAVNRALDSTLEEAMEFESYLQEAQAAGRDFKEGATAFLEKRPANFE